MNPKRGSSFDFDPYKGPPAARLLAVLIIGLLFAWLLRTGDEAQVAQFHRDPAKYAARMDRIAQHGLAFDIVTAFLVVTAIVFAVDGLTTLFGRWLREREHPGNGTPPPDSHHSARVDALLGASTREPPEG